jgi:hypothetical protein
MNHFKIYHAMYDLKYRNSIAKKYLLQRASFRGNSKQAQLLPLDTIRNRSAQEFYLHRACIES